MLKENHQEMTSTVASYISAGRWSSSRN